MMNGGMMYGRPRPNRPMFPNRPRPGFGGNNAWGFGFPFILGVTTGAILNPYYRPYPYYSYPYYY